MCYGIKLECFGRLTADLVKPADLSSDMYKDWGDDMDYSLQLGRGSALHSSQAQKPVPRGTG